MTQRHTFLCSLFLGMFIAAGAGYAAPAVSTEPTTFEETLVKANRGDVPSMLVLARAYSVSGPRAVKVPINPEESYRWYYKVALTGHAESQYTVARSLLSPSFLILKKNAGQRESLAREGVSWLNKAAKQGYAEAYEPLGDASKEGKYADLDLVVAYKWYHLAALKSTRISTRSNAERERNAVSKNLTPAQIIRAKNDADIHLNLMMTR